MHGTYQIPLREKLTRQLNLVDYVNEAQDWPIEVADYKRVQDFLNFYLKSRNSLNNQERQAVLDLILCSYDEYLGCENCGFSDTSHAQSSKIASTIASILAEEFILHQDSIKYWACVDEWASNLDEDCGEDNFFYLTPIIRRIIARVGP